MKTMISFELQKVFRKRLSRVALLSVLLLSVLLACFTYQNKYAYDGKNREGSGKTAVEIDQEIAARYEGILTDEKVQQIMLDFKPTIDLKGLNAAYHYQNALQSAVFFRFSDLNGNWNGARVADVFGNEEIRVGYVDGWLSVSRDLIRIVVVLSLAVIVMIAPIFSAEYEGVDQLILSSKYGKTKGTAAKTIAATLTALFTTALTIAFSLGIAFALYGNSGLDCSILLSSVEYAEGFIPFNLTCGNLLAYQTLLTFTCIFSVTGITLFLSAVGPNQIVSLVGSAAIFLFPVLLPVSETSPLFRYVGLLPLYQAMAISLMSVEQMENGILYAIWAIPAAMFFFGTGVYFSRRIFAAQKSS